ncbi:HEPN/Toprim-associated domain-containing protein [Candidatus Villigracilis affinis]|uniref:HEPN/Toprim-associated domain-containing protein n=1 Tax=Candidatus Villigracilis affinis TaxID=3140682 RepID=UPI001D1B3C86|nr:hypothetical protein [Anaerolineales bacterium]
MKFEVEPWLLSIFRESDKRVFTRKSSEAIGWVHSGEDYEETAYVYSNSIKNIKQRLDVMGFSIHKIQDEFNSVVREQIENVEGKRAQRSDLPELEILKKYIFDDWIDAFKFVLANDISKDNLPENAPELVKYLFSRFSAGLEEFPHEDFLSYLRVYLEACPDDNALVYLDITYLVENDFYYPEDKVCHLGLESLASEYSPYQKIIVLTEGSTDSLILNGSLQLLYPHLYGYYSFMDFGVSNAAGGANILVNNLKAFIGSGISNRVIALFDNDTAAKVSVKVLQTIDIPNNIKVLHYPNLELAKNYPSVGPNGKSENNINGLACSIELYLGLDVLTIDGRLSPIHWKGYDDSLKQYQGEIENKKAIQKNFFAKLEQCSNNSNLIEKTDWSAMRLIFQSIFNAFS